MAEVKLLVREARTKDAGKAIARIHSSDRKQISVKNNDIVEIIGKRKTFAIVKTSLKNDEKGIFRIDGLIRKNAGLSIDSQAIVSRAEVKNAQMILLAPVDMTLNIDQDFTDFVKNRILQYGYPLYEGDSLFAVILGSAIPFNIIRTKPSNIPLFITEDTNLKILNSPVKSIQDKKIVDIKHLSRLGWLNNLLALTNATKAVFLIDDSNIKNENENEVMNIAKKIAHEEVKNVRVEVALESNGQNIGTIPWAEVDIIGRTSIIYPDTYLPPVTPPFRSHETGKMGVSSMSRCFKIGIGFCPKEINFSPEKVVVAMPFGTELKDTYIYAIKPALEESGFIPWKADENINNIDIMCKVCQAIQESGYVLANITGWNPNVVFELGLAYGLGRNAILIKHKKGDVPVDLEGLEYIEYDMIDNLKKRLLLFLKAISL